MIVDICTYNGETDIFDIRYNILREHTDQMIVVEFDKTFSGRPKESYFPANKYKDVLYYLTDEATYGKYYEMARISPNTLGAAHWSIEFAQKESIKDSLKDLADGDLVFIGDCDEIWDPDYRKQFDMYNIPTKITLRVYTYWLNNLSSELFSGTLVSRYKDIKLRCLNHLRSYSYKTNQDSPEELGWHFTSMGGEERVRNKLLDSYTEETYASSSVMEDLASNIRANRDFLGRNFEFRKDEEGWPEYLKENRYKYEHLML